MSEPKRMRMVSPRSEAILRAAFGISELQDDPEEHQDCAPAQNAQKTPGFQKVFLKSMDPEEPTLTAEQVWLAELARAGRQDYALPVALQDAPDAPNAPKSTNALQEAPKSPTIDCALQDLAHQDAPKSTNALQDAPKSDGSP